MAHCCFTWERLRAEDTSEKMNRCRSTTSPWATHVDGDAGGARQARAWFVRHPHDPGRRALLVERFTAPDGFDEEIAKFLSACTPDIDVVVGPEQAGF